MTDSEKRYLLDLIRQWKIQVMYIQKHTSSDYKEDRIEIFYTKRNGAPDSVALPPFEANTKYIGMEVGCPYTPEELGLDEGADDE